MANLTPVSSFDPVRQIEGTDIAQPSTFNGQAQALLNRTEYLKGKTDFLDAERLRLASTSSPSDGAGMIAAVGGSGGTAFATVLGFIQRIVSSVGSALVGFIQSGTGAVARTAQDKMREVVSVKDFGAVGDGVTDDAAAIQAAITAVGSAGGGTLLFPQGTYLVSIALNLASNMEIVFASGAKIKQAPGVTTEYIFRGATVGGLTFRNVVIEGNGLSGLSAVYLTSCTNVLFDSCKITKAGAMAILHDGCTDVTIANSNLSQNYYYGVDDRNGVRSKYSNNLFYLNGNTGVTSSTGGRGINVWKTIDCYASGNSFVANNEYGFRLYSAVADGTTENRASRIIGNYFFDNAASDIVVYNESTYVLRHIFDANIVERTSNTTIGAAVVIQGTNIHFSNTHVYKNGAMATQGAFQLYQASKGSLVNCSAKNFTEAIGMGTSTDCFIDGFLGDTIARVGIPLGSGIRVTNSHFIHGGAGVSDVAIQNYGASGKNYYEQNVFDGFHTGIYIDNEAVSIFRNTTKNSTFAGLRKSGNATSGIECGGNSWDSTNPWEVSTLAKTSSTYDRAVLRYATAPSTLTWAVGDRCFNLSPAVGQPKSWVCTVAGTPGTWVSEGNL